MPRLVNLSSIHTKYHQKVSKGIGVMGRTRFYLKPPLPSNPPPPLLPTPPPMKEKLKLVCMKQKVKKQELSFWCHAGLIHKLNKYYQNISKHMEDMARTSSIPKNSLRGNNYERNNARFVVHARDTPTHPDLHPNHRLSENLKKA